MGKTTATKRPAKTPAAEPAPAAVKWPPYLLWHSDDGEPMGIAATAYEEIKSIWNQAHDWAVHELRARGMDAGRLPEPQALCPSNWNPEMVAGRLYANNETVYRRANPDALAIPPRLRLIWFEALDYLTRNGYPFAVSPFEMFKQWYVRELTGDSSERAILFPLLGDWPTWVDMVKERFAVDEIMLAPYARAFADAITDPNAWSPKSTPLFFGADELRTQERAADIVTAAIERARKCAAPIGEPPRALTRAQMLEWLELAVRDMTPAQPPAAPDGDNETKKSEEFKNAIGNMPPQGITLLKAQQVAWKCQDHAIDNDNEPKYERMKKCFWEWAKRNAPNLRPIFTIGKYQYFPPVSVFQAMKKYDKQTPDPGLMVRYAKRHDMLTSKPE